jgi:hypothetical protein
MMKVPDHLYDLGDTYIYMSHVNKVQLIRVKIMCSSNIHVTRITVTHIIFTRISCALFTCDMYMCRLRHINDPVLSLLKMEGIRLLFYNYLAPPHYFLQQATPHIRLRNMFQGQRCKKQRNVF